jgi:hypothetical protein
MNITFRLLIYVTCVIVPTITLANGRSEHMIQILNAPPPEWLSIGVPLKVEPGDPDTTGSLKFRSRSGGATNSRKRVQIPARGIEIQVDYSIDWIGENKTGYGSSLSPDGNWLIVNSGLTTHLYEILPNDELREVPIQLPHVTYDEGLKGFIVGWKWADNATLLGRAEIDDDTGHETVEFRIYAYFLEKKVLARLDLSALKLSRDEAPEIISISEDLSHMIIWTHKGEIPLKVDLKSPPKILPNELTHKAQSTRQDTPLLDVPTTLVRNESGNEPTPETVGKSGSLIFLWAITAFGASGLFWIFIKRRASKASR